MSQPSNPYDALIAAYSRCKEFYADNPHLELPELMQVYASVPSDAPMICHLSNGFALALKRGAGHIGDTVEWAPPRPSWRTPIERLRWMRDRLREPAPVYIERTTTYHVGLR